MCQTFAKLAWDMNADGLFTYRDVGEWLAWLYFVPGEFIIDVLARTPGNIRFFELSPASCHGSMSALISLPLWVLLLLGLIGFIAVAAITYSDLMDWLKKKQTGA